MAQRKDSIGLGYSGEGGYTHHFWGHIKGEHGPLDIYWMAYETLDQLRELLALLYSLGDQIHLVRMLEPPGIVLQDFLETPFRHQRATQDAALGHAVHSAAEAQIRILDLPEAVRRLSLPGSIEINLTLTDPVARYLEDRPGWRGCAGEYHLRLASHSEATAGHRAGTPQVGMDVGAFSQLWCGARSPEHLATQQKLRTDAKTLSRLAELFRLPRPDFDWIF